jgi:hypothetical protein
MQHLAAFEHFGFFAGWLVAALVLAFLLFYAWELMHRRLARNQDVDLQA